jgi:hypothetical protein
VLVIATRARFQARVAIPFSQPRRAAATFTGHDLTPAMTSSMLGIGALLAT